MDFQPTLESVQTHLADFADLRNGPNLIPISFQTSADLLTPSLAYLKISARARSSGTTEGTYSFLFESASTNETIGRYSYVGANPRRVIKTGPGHGEAADPLTILEKELSQYREASVDGVKMPPWAGGAIGYVGYDAIRYFEPKTAPYYENMRDVVKVPEALFMLFDTVVAFDHFYQTVRVISYVHIDAPYPANELSEAYQKTATIIEDTVSTLLAQEIPLPPQGPITHGRQFTSNIGQDGYEQHVKTLKGHINKGNIIQCVPSQRQARPTDLHPFNIYRHLRTVNPSPYLFYIACGDEFSIVGASPELLVRSIPPNNRIITHPIAGTVKRNLANSVEDERLAQELRDSKKDRAEHVMLVDLARNDVNRVADPLSTKVERLMVVEKFSHVQHLVSEVSGILRPGKTRFDAFRSIFPAGTVSGAPKVKACELVAQLEQEKRGVYAGAVGWWGFDSAILETDQANGTADASQKRAVLRQGAMDTCIALRTMLVKDGVAYLQAGGGIVFDSDPTDEWEETLNKLGANVQCIKGAELRFASEAKVATDAQENELRGKMAGESELGGEQS